MYIKHQKGMVKMEKNEQQPASIYLTEATNTYLEQKAKENNGQYSFERAEIVEYLTNLWSDPRNTDGARTGTLNRLFDSSDKIKKVGHGKYVYTMTLHITTENLLNELNSCYQKIDNLLGNDLNIINEFTREDRRLIYNVQYTLDQLENLIETIKSK